MSWDFWEKVRKADAKSSDPSQLARDARAGFAFSNESFLNSDLFRKASSTKCSSKADCGSGFACIGGTCTKVHTRNGSSWTPSSCGDDTITWVCTNGDKSGDNDSCTRPTPGNCDDNPDCPGERCCRQQLDGSIRCVCGPCDQTDTSTCNVYCDQQYKAFGVVRPGCYTRDMEGFGECGGNICDECRFCEDTGFGYAKCVQGEQDDPFNPLPCHCFPKCAEECHICNKDAGSPGFGECEYSPTNCQQCCTEYNYDCPQCAKVIPVAHHCEPVTSGKPCIQALREKLFKQCEAECLTDPCAPTGSRSHCVDGSAPVDPIANPGGPSGVSCPEGKTCQYTGYIEAGGKTCYLYNTWVTGDIPPQCKECDCNCHDDCPSCQLCGADGKCYPDPACDAYFANAVIVRRDNYSVCLGLCSLYPNYPYGQYVYTGTNYYIAALKEGRVGVDVFDIDMVPTGATSSPQYCGPEGVGAAGAAYYGAFNDGNRISITDFLATGNSGDCPGTGFNFYYEKRYSYTFVSGFGDSQAEAYQNMQSKIPEDCLPSNGCTSPPS